MDKVDQDYMSRAELFKLLRKLHQPLNMQVSFKMQGNEFELLNSDKAIQQMLGMFSDELNVQVYVGEIKDDIALDVNTVNLETKNIQQQCANTSVGGTNIEDNVSVVIDSDDVSEYEASSNESYVVENEDSIENDLDFGFFRW